MTSLKNWFKEEQAAVGHLSGMKDEFLQKRYATKVASGMNHLSEALQEKMDEVVDEDKKRELEIMKNTIMRSLEHVEKDYDVKRTNLSYAWNTSGLVSVPAASLAPIVTASSMRSNPASIVRTNTGSMMRTNTLNPEVSTLSPNTSSLALPTGEEALTLTNVKNYGSLNEEEAETKPMFTPLKGGRVTRKSGKARKSRKAGKTGRKGRKVNMVARR